MNFFKKLFGKRTTPLNENISNNKPANEQVKNTLKNEPISKIGKTNNDPEIEPIVKQVAEYLFKANSPQTALRVIRKYMRERDDDLKTILALLKYSNGDVAVLEKSAQQSHPHFWMDEISPIFRTIEDAEKWASSLLESQKAKNL